MRIWVSDEAILRTIQGVMVALLRKKYGVNGKAFLKYGLSPTNISNIEHGNTIDNREKLTIILKELNVNMDKFIDKSLVITYMFKDSIVEQKKNNPRSLYKMCKEIGAVNSDLFTRI